MKAHSPSLQQRCVFTVAPKVDSSRHKLTVLVLHLRFVWDPSWRLWAPVSSGWRPAKPPATQHPPSWSLQYRRQSLRTGWRSKAWWIDKQGLDTIYMANEIASQTRESQGMTINWSIARYARRAGLMIWQLRLLWRRYMLNESNIGFVCATIFGQRTSPLCELASPKWTRKANVPQGTAQEVVRSGLFLPLSEVFGEGRRRLSSRRF